MLPCHNADMYQIYTS